MAQDCLVGVITALGGAASAIILAVAALVRALVTAERTQDNTKRIAKVESKMNGGNGHA